MVQFSEVPQFQYLFANNLRFLCAVSQLSIMIYTGLGWSEESEKKCFELYPIYEVL